MQQEKDSDDKPYKYKKFIGVKRLAIVMVLGIIGVCFAHETTMDIVSEELTVSNYNSVIVPVTSPLFVSGNTYLDVGVKSEEKVNISGGDDLDTIIYNVVECESSWNNEAIGDHGLARGLAQFHLETFNNFKEKSGMYELDYYNGEDQLKLMKWAFQNGLQSHWSCYAKLGYN